MVPEKAKRTFASILSQRRGPTRTPGDAGHQASISLRNEILEFLEDGGSLDDPWFREMGDLLVSLGLVSGVDMTKEIKALIYLSKSRGWGQETSEAVPAALRAL